MVGSNLKNIKGLTKVTLLRKTNVFSQKGSISKISWQYTIINTYILITQNKEFFN